MEYAQLRATYDAAFDTLRADVCRLQSITRQLSPDQTAKEAARQHVDQTLGVYRECRDKLARFLISLQPVGKPAAFTGAQPVDVWTIGADRRPTGSNDTALGQPAEVQVLAYRLWEEAGRPTGNPDGYWYLAEALRRGRQ